MQKANLQTKTSLIPSQGLTMATAKAEKLVEDHLAVQSLIRAYQVWKIFTKMYEKFNKRAMLCIVLEIVKRMYRQNIFVFIFCFCFE